MVAVARANELVYEASVANFESGLAEFVANPASAAEDCVKRVRAAAVSRSERAVIGLLRNELAPAFARRERAAILSVAPEIVDSCRVVAQLAVERLVAAMRVVGPAPEPKSLRSGGAGIAESYAAWVAELDVLQNIGIVVAKLTEAKYYPPEVAKSRWIVWLNPTSEGRLISLARGVVEASPANMFCALIDGRFTPGLNGADDVRGLVATEATWNAAAAARQPVKVTDPKNARLAADWQEYAKPRTPAA